MRSARRKVADSRCQETGVGKVKPGRCFLADVLDKQIQTRVNDCGIIHIHCGVPDFTAHLAQQHLRRQPNLV
jgi:hypothetical protein